MGLQCFPGYPLGIRDAKFAGHEAGEEGVAELGKRSGLHKVAQQAFEHGSNHLVKAGELPGRW